MTTRQVLIVGGIVGMHLYATRNHAVFHFLPDKFAEGLKSTIPTDSCIFSTARGTEDSNVSYVLADGLAVKILLGEAPVSNIEEIGDVLGAALKDTQRLLIRFTNQANLIIHHNLRNWGFYKIDAKTR